MATASPLRKALGRDRVFAGSGDVSDFFPPAPNLSYLGRPDYLQNDEGYNPELDVGGGDFNPMFDMGQQTSLQRPQNSAVPLGVLSRIQPMREAMHQAAREERVRQDESNALKELDKVDYASPKLSNQLLSIFQKHPEARKSPEILSRVKFFSQLKPEAETFDVEEVADPILYSKAKTEGWDKLSPREARRKAAIHTANRDILGKAIPLGKTEADLAGALDPTTGAYDPLKVAQIMATSNYDPHTEPDPVMQAVAIREGWDKMPLREANRKRIVFQTNRGIEDEAEAMGVPTEELAPFLDKDTGIYDIGKVKGHLRQYGGKAPPVAAIKELAKYQSQIPAEREALLSTENKLAWLQQQTGQPKKTNFTKEEWDVAHQSLSQQKTPSETAMETFINLMSPKQPGAKKVSPDSGTPVQVAPNVSRFNDFTVLVDGKYRTGTKAQIDSFLEAVKKA